MFHLKLFQMVAPLYVSGLLLRVIRIGVKACIDVTLYAELFITSIYEKHILSPFQVFQDVLDILLIRNDVEFLESI